MMSDDSREFLHGVARELYLKHSTIDPNEFLNALDSDAALYAFIEHWEYPTQVTPELEAYANTFGQTLRPPAPPHKHSIRTRAKKVTQ
jgi:hypothetical protein